MTEQVPAVSWTPRSYQKTGVVNMLKQACFGLLFKPGLGKTSVVYMASRILLEKGYVKKILVICPIKPMYRVWPNQKNKYLEFKHLRVGILHGPDKEDVLNDPNYDIYVINPEGLAWLLGVTMETYTTPSGKTKKRPKPHLPRLKWIGERFQMLVVDESTDFRYSSTTRFKILEFLLPKMKRRYIMTGTPMPRAVGDWFGQIFILDQGDALTPYITHFRREYMYPDPNVQFGWLPQPNAVPKLTKKIAHQVQVVKQEGNIDLPELLFNDIWVDLPPEAMARYKSMQKELVSLVESGAVIAANAAVASSKCRQIANGALYHSDVQGEYTEIHDEKIEALRSILNELEGDPLLVTYEFLFDRQRIEDTLEIPCISTGKPKADDLLIERFSRGELSAVQGHPQSISLGIDGLQDNCNNIAMVGVPWNLLHYEQVIDRIRRSGSKSKHVTVHRILARGTVDEKAVRVLAERDSGQHTFMNILKELRDED